MARNIKSFIGQKFNMLTVLTLRDDNKNIYCLCDCGVIKQYNQDNVVYEKKSRTKSCGCLIKSKRGTYPCDDRTPIDLPNTRLKKIYTAMNRRCYTSKEGTRTYKNYRGRGITVCKEWRESRKSFIEWARNNGYSDRLSIDRIDNDKGYSPGNCRWATPLQQSRNQSTTLMLEKDGITKSLRDWVDDHGLTNHYYTIRLRKKRGDRGEHLFRPIREGSYCKTNYQHSHIWINYQNRKLNEN